MDFVDDISSRGSGSLFGTHLLIVVFIRISDFLERLLPEDGATVDLDMLDQTSASSKFPVASAAGQILIRWMSLELSVW